MNKITILLILILVVSCAEPKKLAQSPAPVEKRLHKMQKHNTRVRAMKAYKKFNRIVN